MRRLYRKLRKEYLWAFSGDAPLFYQPLKQSIVLEATEEGNPDKFLNIMSSRLSNGVCGAKIIHVDESTGNMVSYTVMYGKDGIPRIIESAGLTRLRCAFMAALAIEQFFQNDIDTPISLKVGFIGTGRTNLKTAEVLSELFRVNEFVCVGSPLNPAKNIGKFAKIGDATVSTRESGFAALKDCDVVISCTNTTNPGHVLEYYEIAGPKLFIAQDGGYIFGESFRKFGKSFSDYPAQLLSHADHEFPWDSNKIVEMFPLTKLSDYNTEADYPRVAYLYGIALADLVVAGGLE